MAKAKGDGAGCTSRVNVRFALCCGVEESVAPIPNEKLPF